MPRTRITRTPLGNGRYPNMQTCWVEDEDTNGWTGRAAFWRDPSTKEPPEHSIILRQGQPLGSINVITDECIGGCWSMTSFDGTGITERDLQWAAAYAMEALKRKREGNPWN